MTTLLLAPFSVANVYKYVDENGNTIYSDTKPNNAPQEVETLKVQDSYTNTMQAPEVRESDNDADDDIFSEAESNKKKEATYKDTKRKAKKSAASAVKAAQEKLDASKEIKAGDMFPTKLGGMRYTQQYNDRVEAAQQKLDDAQSQYSKF